MESSAIIREEYKSSDFPVFLNADDSIHPMSFVGRLVDDGYNKPLQRAWGRLSRINWDTFREYNQPFFAIYPDEFKGKEIN